MNISYAHPILLWCQTGNAIVTCGNKKLALASGELAYCNGSCTAASDGIVVPIFFPAMYIDGPTRKLHLGSQWSEFMIYEFARSLGYLRGSQALSPEVSRLFADPASPPRIPTAAEARHVAHSLAANPADQTALEEFAERHDVSARTLQRQFLASTGLTFSEWRTAYRVSAAAELLSHDFSVAVVANLVGFAATSSLTRAFRRHTGCTPSAYTPGTVGMGEAGEPPQVPSSSTWHRNKDQDIILWVYKGTATLTTTGYCRFLGTGDIATIPAGTNTRLDISSGSIALPLGLGDDIDSKPSLEQVVERYSKALGAVAAEPTSGINVFGFTQKMGEARHLLRRGLRPKEVSRAVGYTTTSAFSKAFKQMHGLSPRDYQSRKTQEQELAQTSR